MKERGVKMSNYMKLTAKGEWVLKRAAEIDPAAHDMTDAIPKGERIKRMIESFKQAMTQYEAEYSSHDEWRELNG